MSEIKVIQINTSSFLDTPALWLIMESQVRIYFQRHLFLPQLLIGQEPLSYQCLVTTETVGVGVPSSDLERLENDLEIMLKVVEKHSESRDDEEKVGSFQNHVLI
jgi:hypothetical protein